MAITATKSVWPPIVSSHVNGTTARGQSLLVDSVLSVAIS